MIYKHKHINPKFLKQEHIKQITYEQPLIILLQQNQFLHYTISKTLHYLQIPHRLQEVPSGNLEHNLKIMEHEIPALIFGDKVLETMPLIQFLCDAFFQKGDIINFQSRKALVKQLANTWKEIFMFERFEPHHLKRLATIGVNNKKDYQNTIMKEFQLFKFYFRDKTLKKAFPEYTEDHPALESILFVDIISTIIHKVPSSFVDYALRSHYSSLLTISSSLKKTIDEALPINEVYSRHFVMFLELEQTNEVEWEKFRLNLLRFLIAFGVVGALYGTFVEV